MKEGRFAKSPLALTGGFSLFLALNAGLFVMLALTHFLENAAAGALPLKPFERTFQGLIFADTNLGHCYPSPRSIQWPADHTNRKPCFIIQPLPGVVNFFSGKRFVRPFCLPSDGHREYGNEGDAQTGRHRDRSWKQRDSRQSGSPVPR